MAKIERITVSSGATINMGNYENLRRDVTVEARLDKGEDRDAAFAELQFEADLQLATSVVPVVEADLRPEAAYIAKADGYKWRLARAEYESPLFRWLNKFMPELAAEVLAEVLKTVPTDTDAIAAAEPDEAPDDDDGASYDDPDPDDEDDEPDYTGDGFTEEHDDGYPEDAHPDEVEYEQARTTYPDLPPYAEDDDDDEDTAWDYRNGPKPADVSAQIAALEAEPETCSSCGQPKDGEWCVNEACEAGIPF